MKTKLPNSITTVEGAKIFLTELYNNGEAYHPEDNAKDCFENITNEEGNLLNKLMNEIYLLPGNEHYQTMVFDPCEFILNLDPEYTAMRKADEDEYYKNNPTVQRCKY